MQKAFGLSAIRPARPGPAGAPRHGRQERAPLTAGMEEASEGGVAHDPDLWRSFQTRVLIDGADHALLGERQTAGIRAGLVG